MKKKTTKMRGMRLSEATCHPRFKTTAISPVM
jgi:hypothetical protein